MQFRQQIQRTASFIDAADHVGQSLDLQQRVFHASHGRRRGGTTGFAAGLSSRFATGLSAGLAAAAVALTVAGTLGSSAKLGADRPAAPAATFRTIDGRDVTLAGLRGQPVALYFMASWCGTCVPEAQAWGQIARDGSVQGLQVFVVDVDPVDSAQALAGFRDRYVGDGLHWVFDADQALTRAFGTIQAKVLDHACAELKATLGEIETLARTRSAADAVALQAKAFRRGYESLSSHLGDLAATARKELPRP